MCGFQTQTLKHTQTVVAGTGKRSRDQAELPGNTQKRNTVAKEETLTKIVFPSADTAPFHTHKQDTRSHTHTHSAGQSLLALTLWFSDSGCKQGCGLFGLRGAILRAVTLRNLGRSASSTGKNRS